MLPKTRETAEERKARFAAEEKYCREQAAKTEAEYLAKGYDKIMSLDEAETLVMLLMEKFV